VIEDSPPGGFEPTTREPPAEDPGPDPERVDIDLDQIGEVESDRVPEPIHDEPATVRNAVVQVIEESLPGSLAEKSGRVPVPEPPERADDPDGKRRSFTSVAELRTALAEALQKVHKQGELERSKGAAREIVAFVAEIRKSDPEFADKTREYFDAIENPEFLETNTARLWQQAGANQRTTADETVHILGNGTPETNHFSNKPNLTGDPYYADFQTAMRDPRTLIDESNASDFHGSHIHAYHEYLGDCLWGPGEGRKFRQKLADLTGPTKTLSTGIEQPFMAQVWDALFDAGQGDGLHSPEALGKILQELVGFPRRAPSL
jgi:hypothetical protein